MPELPEVETIRRILGQGTEASPSILGKTIQSADLFWERTLATPPVEVFLQRIAGQQVRAVGRRGKFLSIELSDGFVLIHLRMSGDILIEKTATSIGSHTRLVLNFADGWRLSFIDPRKFGRVWLVEHPEEVLGGLGPEPLAAEFTAEQLYERLKTRHRQLKPLLLDQTFIAGLGNIYADEALNLAHLHPLLSADQLSAQQSERLWWSIRQVLSAGIQRNGTSIDWVYRGGDFQNYLRVYGRSGEPCPDCGTPIERIVVGQRGTHYCPHCQSLPAAA